MIIHIDIIYLLFILLLLLTFCILIIDTVSFYEWFHNCALRSKSLANARREENSLHHGKSSNEVVWRQTSMVSRQGEIDVYFDGSGGHESMKANEK